MLGNDKTDKSHRCSVAEFVMLTLQLALEYKKANLKHGQKGAKSMFITPENGKNRAQSRPRTPENGQFVPTSMPRTSENGKIQA